MSHLAQMYGWLTGYAAAAIYLLVTADTMQGYAIAAVPTVFCALWVFLIDSEHERRRMNAILTITIAYVATVKAIQDIHDAEDTK